MRPSCPLYKRRNFLTKHHRRRIDILLSWMSAVFLVLFTASACSNTPAGTSRTQPITIGISVSLSGDFSDDGKLYVQGYKLWADTVNKHGGLLGRPVQLDIVSDASSPEQVQTNYQKLITVDQVDLVFGLFSSLLTKPASAVANRYGYALIEGAGIGPSVFNRGLHNLFCVSLITWPRVLFCEVSSS